MTTPSFFREQLTEILNQAAALPAYPGWIITKRDRQMQNSARYPSLHGQGVFITGVPLALAPHWSRIQRARRPRDVADLNLEAGSLGGGTGRGARFAHIDLTDTSALQQAISDADSAST